MFDPTIPHIEETTMWRTKDGKLHLSTDDATGHIVTMLENIVGPIIDEANCDLNPSHAIGTKAKVLLVACLVGTPEKASELKRLLSTILD